jgi:hypothetical protein
MNPHLLEVQLPYAQQEMARARGRRDWVRFLRTK